MNVRVTKTESITNRTMLAVDKLQKLSDRWLTGDERQLVDRAMAQSGKNADAGFLCLLYDDYGFTVEQLTEFITKFREKYAYIENDLSASVEELSEVERLRELGIDLDEIYGE